MKERDRGVRQEIDRRRRCVEGSANLSMKIKCGCDLALPISNRHERYICIVVVLEDI